MVTRMGTCHAKSYTLRGGFLMKLGQRDSPCASLNVVFPFVLSQVIRDSTIQRTPQESFDPYRSLIVSIFAQSGFNDHHYDESEYYLGCDICGSIAHKTADCTMKSNPTKRKPRIASQRSNEPIEKYSKESDPKVVFRDNSSCDIERYGSINCSGITFTRFAYVNGLKHNLINISQLCDANFKVLFIKTQGTIFNQNNEVVLITPRRRDVYVIDMPSYNEDSNACFFAKASNNVN
ncbi:hypothetical protein Tco_1333028 [Tanacetum coccineum]